MVDKLLFVLNTDTHILTNVNTCFIYSWFVSSEIYEIEGS